MNRRAFITAIMALPFVGRALAAKERKALSTAKASRPGTVVTGSAWQVEVEPWTRGRVLIDSKYLDPETHRAIFTPNFPEEQTKALASLRARHPEAVHYVGPATDSPQRITSFASSPHA